MLEWICPPASAFLILTRINACSLKHMHSIFSDIIFFLTGCCWMLHWNLQTSNVSCTSCHLFSTRAAFWAHCKKLFVTLCSGLKPSLLPLSFSSFFSDINNMLLNHSFFLLTLLANWLLRDDKTQDQQLTHLTNFSKTLFPTQKWLWHYVQGFQFKCGNWLVGLLLLMRFVKNLLYSSSIMTYKGCM